MTQIPLLSDMTFVQVSFYLHSMAGNDIGDFKSPIALWGHLQT